MRDITICFIFICVLIIGNSCSDIRKIPSDVVISGTIKNNKNPFPCFWDNKKRFDFQVNSKDQSFLRGLLIKGNDIYTCGSFEDGQSFKAFYSKNNEIIILNDSSSFSAECNAFIMHNDSIITVGSFEQKGSNSPRACYWINKKRYTLCDKKSFATDICILEDSIYILGHIVEDKHNYLCYWTNGKTKYISDSLTCFDASHSSSIAIFENKVVIVSRIEIDFVDRAFIWQNDSLKYLENPYGIYSNPTSIKIIDGKIFITGFISGNKPEEPCYWIDGKLFLLDSPYSFAMAKSILKKDDDIIVVGEYREKALSIPFPCFWVNNVFYSLKSSDLVYGTCDEITEK